MSGDALQDEWRAMIRATLAAALARVDDPGDALDGMAYASVPEVGVELDHPVEDVVSAAEDALATFRDEAGDGWSEEVNRVEWGVALPVMRAQMVDVVDTPDGPFDYQCDYVLRPVADANDEQDPEMDAFEARLRKHLRDDYPWMQALAARFGVAQPISDSAYHEVAAKRGPAQGYQEVAMLALVCRDRPDAVPLFRAGLERLSRRSYWSGGHETLAIDAPALLALAIGAVDAKCADVRWLVALLRESRQRMRSEFAAELLSAALSVLGHPDRLLSAGLLAACVVAGLLPDSGISVAQVRSDVRSGTGAAAGSRSAQERAVVLLAAARWVADERAEGGAS